MTIQRRQYRPESLDDQIALALWGCLASKLGGAARIQINAVTEGVRAWLFDARSIEAVAQTVAGHMAPMVAHEPEVAKCFLPAVNEILEAAITRKPRATLRSRN